MSYNKEYLNVYMKKRYAKRKQDAIEFLGGVCAVCGTDENLQFDHINRTEKEFTIADCMLWSKERFWNEIKKCQLLCEFHHNEKTHSDNNIPNRKFSHGHISCYKYCHCDLCRKAKNEWTKEYRKTHLRKS